MTLGEKDGTYEGLQFGPALGMALMESSGIRKMIDDAVPKECVNLSAGMASKAVIGTMFTEGTRKPLYRVGAQYATTPVERVFGPYVRHASLSSTSIASRLDAISGIDTDALLWKCRETLCGIYGLRSDRYHMDATNFPYYGTGYKDRADGGAMPMYSKNSKAKRNDLMQKCVQGICDSNGIIAYARSYDGNTSDIEMNRDSLEFLKGYVDCSKSTVSADCKLCTAGLIRTMIDMNIGFVTKVPSSFSGKIRDDIVSSAVTGVMDDVGGRQIYDTDARIDDDDNDLHTDLRFVAYRLPDSLSDAEMFLRGQGLKDMEKRMTALKRRRYFCEDDAKKAFAETLSGGYAPAYTASAEYEEDRVLMKKHPDKPHWRVRPGNVTVEENAVSDHARRYSVSVLATNLPRTEYDSVNPRNGASANGAVNVYTGNFAIEHAFKQMKSGLGAGRMYIHTPSRQDAIVFLSSLAATMSGVVGAVLKRSSEEEERITIKHIADFMLTTIVRYDREKNSVYVTGDPGAPEKAWGIVGALNIDRKFLLGY